MQSSQDGGTGFKLVPLTTFSLRIALTTLGCKVNQYDTATIEDRLRDEGHECVSFADTADVYIVNSCAVTNQADAESRNSLAGPSDRTPWLVSS